ncbi:MAG: hypothetical protein CEN87_354 [Parcubacteria group bacterium Licking1014_1]|nr:MAG: hypothetical protein CEN87_354 [Parcubacteria group bacterium Licking1014_1]
MDANIVFLFIFGFTALFLAVLNVFLLFYFFKTNKKIDALSEKGKIKNFKDLFLRQIKINEEQDEKIKGIFDLIKNLENISEKTIQKTGIVRFNPFNDLGGNQSFAVVLLDKKNNGFVISNLFGKEGSRVYAKAVREGKSDYALSREEQEAVERAISSGNSK